MVRGWTVGYWVPVEFVIIAAHTRDVDVPVITEKNVHRRRHDVRRPVQAQRDGVGAAARNQPDPNFRRPDVDVSGLERGWVVVFVDRAKEEAVEEFREHSVAADADDAVDVVERIRAKQVSSVIGSFSDDDREPDAGCPEQWRHRRVEDVLGLAFTAERVDENQDVLGSAGSKLVKRAICKGHRLG